jgi:hypothetical protein
MPRCRQRKCRNCGQLYRPDPRNRWHQRYCSKPACRWASKVASRRRWRRSAAGRDYWADAEFRGCQVAYVQQWRKEHPDYWHPHNRKSALKDLLFAQTFAPPGDDTSLHPTHQAPAELSPAPRPSETYIFRAQKAYALKDLLFTQLSLQIGLTAHLFGALKDDIAPLLHRLILLGRQIQGCRPQTGAAHGHGQASVVPGTVAQGSASVQLGGSAPGTG